MSARVLVPDLLHRDGELREGEAVLVDAAGTIVEAGPVGALRDRGAVVRLPGRALLPGLVNGHSHCWQVLLRGLGSDPRDFRAWVDEQLYPTVERLDVELFGLAARLCFAEMLRMGITTVGEFHYVHRGPGGEDVEDAYDLEVLAAARAVGIRIALARTMYDRGGRPGQKRFLETPDEAVAAGRRLAAAVAGDPTQTVLPAPHSLHGASAEMLEAAGALATELGTRFHIHLAEQPGDLEVSQELHGTTPLGALEKLGLLDARTVLVHGIYNDEDAIRRLGEAGGALVYNPGTNMLLGDGIAPLPTYVAAGVDVGLGTDANARPDILEELRLAEQLQRATRVRMNVLPNALGAAPFLSLATEGGAKALGLDVGALAAGRPADMVAIRLDAPSLQPALSPDAVLHALVHAARPLECVDRVWVQGRLVVDRGAPTRVPLAPLASEVTARARERLGA